MACGFGKSCPDLLASRKAVGEIVASQHTCMFVHHRRVTRSWRRELRVGEMGFRRFTSARVEQAARDGVAGYDCLIHEITLEGRAGRRCAEEG